MTGGARIASMPRMPILKPVLPPYDIGEWQRKPFPERVKMVCQSWALQGYGTPWPIYIVYVLKVAFYVWMWAATTICALPGSLASWRTRGQRWSTHSR